MLTFSQIKEEMMPKKNLLTAAALLINFAFCADAMAASCMNPSSQDGGSQAAIHPNQVDQVAHGNQRPESTVKRKGCSNPDPTIPCQ